MIVFILSVLVLLGLGGVAFGIHAISAELRGLDGTDEASKTTEARKNAKIRKEIERWRSGQ